MKICASCRRTYSEASQFCLEDGSPLQALPRPGDEPAILGPSPVPVAPADMTLPTAGLPPVGRIERQRTLINPNPPATLSEAQTFVTTLEPIDDTPPALNEEEQSAYIGKLIDDRYLVVSLIGRGGMGAVYRVEQIHLRKVMAIKLLHENLVARKQLVSRFTREARAISRLSSPHTVMVYDFGRWGELFYLVMELLEGEALDALLEREGPLPAERVARIVLQMCDSLAEAHKHGVVHRDLKPENIMMVTGAAHPDFVKILDFGLAKVKGADDPYTIHSQRDIFGTPYYMSPEQIRAGDVDHRADIYAVGALMFRMLTGTHVFGGERPTFDILKAHLMEPPPKMAEVAPAHPVPAVLEQIVAKALEKDPAKRFQSMAELGEALIQAQKTGFADVALPGGTSPSASTSRAPRKAKLPTADYGAYLVEDELLRAKAGRAQRSRAIAFFAAVLVALAGIGGWLWLDSKKSMGRESEPNDSWDQANSLGPQNDATGVIGKRRSGTAADQDCFRMPPVKDMDDVTVQLSGVPNMDLQVSLHGADGSALLTQSHRGRGRGEELRHPDLRKPVRTLCITEYLPAGAVASESLSDRYTLHVLVQAGHAGLEREPNDEGQGNEIAPEALVSASLDGEGDRDVFALQSQLGPHILSITVEVDGSQPGMRLALVDATNRILASQMLRPDEHKATLAFLPNQNQMPSRVVVQPQPAAGVPWPGVEYTLRYAHTGLADQPESEPNNTAESATPMVLGAWHVGQADDAAGVDYLRIDGGDPAMRRIRVEAIAPQGSAYWLVVHDVGTQVDVQRVLVLGGSVGSDLTVSGSGEGFLLKIQQTGQTPTRHGQAAQLSRYQVRARFLSAEEASQLMPMP
ncbi:MAG: serine/threonine-protein kinase [Myxococcota bacterium]